MFRHLLPIALWLAFAVPASADVVTLANGDTLNGEVIEWAVDHVVIEHEQLGRVRLALDQLKIDTGEEPSRGLFDTRFLRGWRRRINLGWNGRQGDETRTNITAAVDFSYSDPFKRWNLFARYFFQTASDDDPDNNLRVDLTRDWLFPGSRWFGRGSFIYQFDEFESWQHRTILTGGPGYNFLKTEAHEVDFVLAPAYTREYGEGGENRGEVLFETNYTWLIWEDIKFTLDNQLFTRVTDSPGDIRNFTFAGLEIPLMEKPELSLRITIENEFESDPDPGNQQNDLLYNTTLGLGF